MNSEKLSKPFDNSELIGVESALSAHLTRRKIRQEAATDLETFAREFLRIRTKSGATTPLLFNGAQRELHRRIEEQRAKTGRVRVIALKAQQVGVSTYVAARLSGPGPFTAPASARGSLRTNGAHRPTSSS